MELALMSSSASSCVSLSSLFFSCLVVSDSLWPHGLQHARLPCPSPSPELSQTHIHWGSDAVQPSHPLSSLSPTFNLSQHQGLFQWISSSHQVAKVLEFQLQHQFFQWVIRIDFLWDWLVWSLCGPRDLKSLLQHYSSKASIIWCSAFFMVQISHPSMTTGNNHSFDYTNLCRQSNVSAF